MSRVLPVDGLRAIFGDAVTFDVAECLAYGYDNSRRQAQPGAVVFPTQHAQVLELVRACRAARVPVIARGRGTNTTGATVPVQGGVVVSFERMNRIIRIDAEDGAMCAQVKTTWVLIEKASGRPKRVPPQMLALFS